MVEIRRVPGDGSLADAHAVRRAVFINEQGVPEAEEMDGRDKAATHVVAYLSDTDTQAPNGDVTPPGGETGRADRGESRPVGTARLRVPEPGVAKPERVAVLEPYRGADIGRRLMDAIEAEARDQGCVCARLHAQVRVEAFYRGLGYETTSGVFEEAAIPHVEMQKQL